MSRSEFCATLAVALAVLSALFYSLYAGNITAHCAGDVCTEESDTLLEAHGPVFLLVLLAPVAVAMVGLASFRLRGLPGLAALAAAAIALSAFGLVAIASIGLYYLPAALLLLLAVGFRGSTVRATRGRA